MFDPALGRFYLKLRQAGVNEIVSQPQEAWSRRRGRAASRAGLKKTEAYRSGIPRIHDLRKMDHERHIVALLSTVRSSLFRELRRLYSLLA